MKLKLGYLLPTRERIMSGQSETAPLLALAEKAEEQGYDSVWVGDSLLARPRHEPLTTLAAIAARTKNVSLARQCYFLHYEILSCWHMLQQQWTN